MLPDEFPLSIFYSSLKAKLARVNRGFASDNAATVHPQVLEAIAAANDGHAFGYGHDALTERVQAQFARRVRRERPGVPGVQRQRRERARDPGRLPPATRR